jgi:hypothetical protein
MRWEGDGDKHTFWIFERQRQFSIKKTSRKISSLGGHDERETYQPGKPQLLARRKLQKNRAFRKALPTSELREQEIHRPACYQ